MGLSAYLALVSTVIAAALPLYLHLRIRATERACKKNVGSLLDAIGGVKEAVATASGPRLIAIIEPAPSWRSRGRVQAPAADDEAGESTEAPFSIAILDEHGGRIPLDDDVAAALATVTGGEALDMPEVLQRVMKRGLDVLEDAGARARIADEDDEEETTGVTGPFDRTWMDDVPEAPPAFADLEGVEDAAPRRRAGRAPAVKPEAPTGEGPSADEEERTTQPDASGPVTPPKPKA